MINIKTEKEIELMKKAGHLNYMAREYIKSLIVPGITTGEIDKLAEEYILSIGGIPGFKNYDGFPGSICISVNDEIVHGIPGDRVLKNGDIVSIDVGVIYNGYHSDAAETVGVGDINKQKEYLIRHTEASFRMGLREVKEGAKIGNIGAKIQSYRGKRTSWSWRRPRSTRGTRCAKLWQVWYRYYSKSRYGNCD